MSWQRPDGRQPNQLRPLKFELDYTKYSASSVLAHCGNTKVLCNVTIEPGVPRFLFNSGKGWLTAEYRMLPGSTQERNKRETMRLSGRTQEIQRLIGRSLRAAVNFKTLGEWTIIVDADVIQADGGTRTTAITGGYVALASAINNLLAKNKIRKSPLRHGIAAVSVGIVAGVSCLDLNYPEDSGAEVDFNVVMTDKLHFIEVQGTGESGSYTRNQLNGLLDLAQEGIEQVIVAQKEALGIE